MSHPSGTKKVKRQPARLILISAVVAIAAVAYWAHEKYDPVAVAKRCQRNIAQLADAEEEYCRRHGRYVLSAKVLAGDRGWTLGGIPTCPLDGSQYGITADKTTDEIQITCV